MSKRSRGASGAGRPPRRALVALMAAGVCLLAASPVGRPSQVAAATVLLDVSPEVDQGPVGTTFTLVATAYDGNGAVMSGGGRKVNVRFFFLAGSPNAPASHGNQPDLGCQTDATGSCAVTYVALNPGTDLICGIVSGSSKSCDEALGAPELNDDRDTVERIVTGAADPSPSDSPSASPSDNPSPSDSPSASPSDNPSPSDSPSASPSANPSPSDSPSASPGDGPSASPAVDPTASVGPGDAPTEGTNATPAPSPFASPTPSASPSATPAPTPSATPAPTPTSPAPTPTSPAPTPTSPTPTPTAPAPTPSATPAPTPTATTPTPSAAASPVTSTAPTPPAASMGPDSTPPSPSPTPDEALAFRPSPSSGDSATPSPETGAVLGAVSGDGDRPAPSPTSDRATSPQNVGATVDPGDPRHLVAAAIAEAVGRVESVVKPEAAVAIATTFGFPLVLMLAVLLFLAGQWLIDRRDPKLRMAPRTVTETLLDFQEEDEL